MGKNNHPDLDNPTTTINRRAVVLKKNFIRQIYTEWYSLIKEYLPVNSKTILELGSGPGLSKEIIPFTISSDLLFLPFNDLVLNGINLPFSQACIDAVFMVDVFHHVPDPEQFFTEFIRVLRPGGRVIMIEPWMTRWSRWVYRNFHHEALDTETPEWHFASSGPLSGANQALPWIVFNRDRQRFDEHFEELKVINIQPFMPIAYLLGGGFSNKISMPGFSYKFFRKIEKKLFRQERTGMFCLIVLEKTK